MLLTPKAGEIWTDFPLFAADLVKSDRLLGAAQVALDDPGQDVGRRADALDRHRREAEIEPGLALLLVEVVHRQRPADHAFGQRLRGDQRVVDRLLEAVQ